MFICRVASKENRKLTRKRPELPIGFQAKVCKDCVRVSSWTFFWLVGGEVTGCCCLGNVSRQLSGSNQSGSTCLLWSISSHHPLPGGGGP